ncbi:acyl-CoA dehydrogenase family protein [Desulfovirgula thermocuniculi]|uniref:acyl-CoA dehydrogenase family protein n=1 Tax=Desulfovirgula thermocuniculi TaxID=348842 RepID=UPI000684A58F|nr:acyl-CoA dehydrogenase family protein [Desulfovirgula thermocuniculi]
MLLVSTVPEVAGLFDFNFMLTPEQERLREEVVQFVKEVPRQLILDMDAERVHYPREFVQAAASRRLLGLRFAPEYGGRGLDWASEVVALEEVGVLGAALSCLYSLPSIVGEAIYVFGTEEQRQKYLKPTLEGRLFCAEALTEPRGGSDFFGTTTVAKKEGDHYILTGQKRFIVGAEGADYFLVYARTDEQAPPHRGISAFIVERGPKVKVEHVYGLMGTRGGGTGRVVFDGCPVPRENLLGEENGGATVFYRMMVPERLTTAAGALGMARAALEVAARYSARRKAFGRVIKEFQGVSFKVAESITLLDAARSLVYATARAVDSDRVPPGRVRRLVSEAKKFATETAWQVINHAMQIMGGIGYTRVYPVERLLRDARLMMIWTGTNEVMNLIIQHEYYRDLAGTPAGRDVEHDAVDATCEEEKVYE